MGDWNIVQTDVTDWAVEYNGKKFHACLCDPPYSLHFMNRAWDDDIAFRPETWAALSEHLLPGAWLMAFGSSRGWHRLACAIEDSGMIIQPSIFVEGVGVVDCSPLILHLSGQSFPKSVNIGKALDKRAGAEREVVAPDPQAKRRNKIASPLKPEDGWNANSMGAGRTCPITAPATPLARAWEGHRYGGQILRDVACPIVCAQKPWGKNRLDDIVATGAGVLNIDAARVSGVTRDPRKADGSLGGATFHGVKFDGRPKDWDKQQGRWPPNFAITHFAMTLPSGEVWGCERVLVPAPCPACSGAGCPDCGGSGSVERGAMGRVKGGFAGFKKPQHFALSGYGIDDVGTIPAQSGYADEDGKETVPRYLCARCCGTGCGTWWLAETPTPCPECGGAGEWGCSVRRLDESVKGTGPSFRKGDRLWNVGLPGQRQKVEGTTNVGYSDAGGPSRYYPSPDFSHETSEALALGPVRKYQAKPSRAERDAGLEGMALKEAGCYGEFAGDGRGRQTEHTPARNNHPCVKSIALTKWLATLLLPPAIYAPRRLLNVFSGTGSEAIGALLAGWEHVTMVEMDENYCQMAEARCRWWQGWSERTGATEPKVILKAARKAEKQAAKEAEENNGQLTLDLPSQQNKV